MPTVKFTDAVVDKLVHLCNTYASGVLGERFGWQDLERVCGLPYQTLGKNPRIFQAYHEAKQALRKLRGAQVAIDPVSKMKPTELEKRCAQLEEQNAALEKKLRLYELRFATFLHNIAKQGLQPDAFEKPIQESLKYAARKKNNIKSIK